MSTFITRLEAKGNGPTLAVKDLIDVKGVPTTAGSRVIADDAIPATSDAPLLIGAREADVRIVGKANLYELAFGASGVNEWFGTPVNPLDASLVPGGSSSGSAVAVANGDAMVAYGTDSGGSVRVPAAFCGTTGLKTTFGRISLGGVFPLSPSLDTVGPMARNVAGVALGMRLLEPDFLASDESLNVIGRVIPVGVAIDPIIQEATDRVLRTLGLEVVEIVIEEWREVFNAGATVLTSEAARTHAALMDDRSRWPRLSEAVQLRLTEGAAVTKAQVLEAQSVKRRFDTRIEDLFERVQLLILPSVGFFPPPLTQWREHTYTELTMPFNLSGLPALSLPIRASNRLPASVQIAAPWGGEELLISAGTLMESVADWP